MAKHSYKFKKQVVMEYLDGKGGFEGAPGPAKPLRKEEFLNTAAAVLKVYSNH